MNIAYATRNNAAIAPIPLPPSFSPEVISQFMFNDIFSLASIILLAICFNPRPYVRGDVSLRTVYDVLADVSIHAPM